ncbi:MAG: hypothetical protein AAGE96_19195 [Cyanobacteria bacterium P01_G01_bin.19]
MMKLLKLAQRAYNSSSPSLKGHILRSYSSLRWYMGGLSLLLPLLLVVGGIKGLWWLDSPLEMQNSLSAYYHAGAECSSGDGVYRDLFVGILAAISFCLVLYTGFGGIENWLLNFAGVFLAGVAFFPMGWPEAIDLARCQQQEGFEVFKPSLFWGFPLSVHFVSAIAFFIMLLLVSFCTAMDTLNETRKINNQALEQARREGQDTSRIERAIENEGRWRIVFTVVRFLMPASLIVTGIVWWLFLRDDRLVLWIEWVGIWVFSLYWLLKSFEILNTQVDLDAIDGRINWDKASTKKFK